MSARPRPGPGEPQTFTAEDGMTYEWMEAANAWFPVAAPDLIAQQQAAYAYKGPPPPKKQPKKKKKTPEPEVPPGKVNVNRPRKKNKKKKDKKKNDKEVNQSKDPRDRPNPHVYVTGLPPDVTADELNDHFRKCGLIRVDTDTGEPKIKIYRDDNGKPKGDARITYYRVESVPIAVEILDESYLRADCQVHVEPAQFTWMSEPGAAKRGGDDDADKARKKARGRKRKKIFDQTRDLAWDNAAEQGRHLPRTVVLKNMWKPEDMLDITFLDELKEDLEPEFARYGTVHRMVVYDTNPEAVVTVEYTNHDGARACFEKMRGRFFGGRQISAEYWDQVSRYKVQESEEIAAKRLEMFGDFLEGTDNLNDSEYDLPAATTTTAAGAASPASTKPAGDGDS